MREPLRVAVVAADPLVREALSARLRAAAGVDVAGDAAPDDDLRIALRGADVVLWDVPGPSAELPDAAPRGTVVVALVSAAAEGRAALAAGATAVIRRDADAERIAAAAQAAMAGLVTLDPDVPGLLAARPGDAPAEPLTPRERDVLQLLALGLTNHAIAERLGITEHTAKFHVNSILGKLGASTRTEAIVHAARLGLVLL